METVRIRRVTLNFILEGARRFYPNEFMGLLRKNARGVVAEVLMVPMAEYGEDFASMDFWMLPAGSRACGSVHSHPSRSARPSQGDLQFFSRVGGVQLIVCYPFTEKEVRAYDSEGKKISWEIVE